jgi:hypothetical protein
MSVKAPRCWSFESWSGYAALCLFLGQIDDFRRTRHTLLERFGTTTDPIIAGRVGLACLLLPATGEELRNATALADRAVAAGPRHPNYVDFMVAKGLAEYRQDRPDSAIDWLEKASAGGAALPARLVLAMARHRRGQLEKARQTLTAGINSYDWDQYPVRNQDLWICHLVRREAEALILPNPARNSIWNGPAS